MGLRHITTVARSLVLSAGIVTLIALYASERPGPIPRARSQPLSLPAGYLFYHEQDCDHPVADMGCCGAMARPHGFDRALTAANGPVQPLADGRLMVSLHPDDRKRLMRQFGLTRLFTISAIGVEVVTTRTGADVATVVERLRAERGCLLAEPDYLARVTHDKKGKGGKQDKKRRGVALLKRILKSLDPIHRSQPALDHIKVREAWKKYCTGCSPIKVAVIDSGVDPYHEDLSATLQQGWDFVNSDKIPEDNLGHGTAMAGIIGAPGDNKVGIAGLCWSTQIIPVKVADSQGLATFSNLARGIIWAVEQGARVINISLGGRADSVTLRRACKLAAQQGVLIVAPAGNDNTNLLAVPARYPEVLAVASTSSDRIGLVTNLTNQIDVAASGEDIVSTVPGSLYSVISGTSVAAAHISGVAALVLSHRPNLKLAQIRSVLRRAVDPIDALTRQEEFFDFGRINVLKALGESEVSTPDAGIRRVHSLPRRPRPGQRTILRIQIANRGNRPYPAGQLKVTLGDQVLERQTPPLAVGQRRIVAIEVMAPATSDEAQLNLSTAGGEIRTTDNTHSQTIDPLAEEGADLAIVEADIPSLPLETGRIPLDVVIENRGNIALGGTQVSIFDRSDQSVLSRSAAASLAIGDRRKIRLWIPLGQRKQRNLPVLIQADSNSRDATPRNNTGLLLVPLSQTKGAQLYYQQSGGIDIIPDAPFRMQTNRPYLPIQIFVPYQGGKGEDRFLQLSRATITMRDTPTGGGTTVFDDRPDQPPTTAIGGLSIIDEMGRETATTDLFGPKGELKVPGRHQIIRLPLATLGIPSDGTEIIEKYFEVKLQWDHMRRIFYDFDSDRSGTVCWVLKVRFTPHELPRIPGMEQYYYDAHHHTIAEWFTGDKFRLFAPKKAYGGPIQMIRETAWAIGLVEDPNDIKHKIMTTDHNVFFTNEKSPGVPTTDDEYRPPFGPTSANESKDADGNVKSEWQRYLEIFGLSAGEEVAFAQGQALGIVPLGAHMLTHRCQHFEGPWHGGSPFSESMDEGEKLLLDTILHTLAKKNQELNRRAYVYAAHPFTAQGWNTEHLEMALGLRDEYRTDRYVNTSTKRFVFRGLQLWNGKHERSMPSSDINQFELLNPWANSEYAQGDVYWDATLWKTLDHYNQYLTQNMVWAFRDQPKIKFIRKLYGEAGTDAHGDFNFATERAATMIGLSFTYAVNSNAWAKVRTLAFGAGMPGTTPHERLIEAMASGNSVMTDGPVLHFTVDADTKFDSNSLTYHDRIEKHENNDGQLGGGGNYGGQRTALVIRSSPYLAFRYRYRNTPEFGTGDGEIKHIKIYRSSASTPNPSRKINVEGAAFYQAKSYQRPVSVGSLAPGGEGKELAEPVNVKEEGVVGTPTAFYLGGFTGADPDTANSAPDDARCYTNPIWVIPVDVRVDLEQSAGTIPAGGLKLSFHFPVSIKPEAYRIAVKVLDTEGKTTGSTGSPLTLLDSLGWSEEGGTAHARYRLTNKKAIQLSGLSRYPDNDTVSLLIYFQDVPKDIHDNRLNSVAFKLPISVQPGEAGSSAVTPGGDSSGNTTPDENEEKRDPNTEGAGGLKDTGGSGASSTSNAGRNGSSSDKSGTGTEGKGAGQRLTPARLGASGSGAGSTERRLPVGENEGGDVRRKLRDQTDRGSGRESGSGRDSGGEGPDAPNDGQDPSTKKYREPVVIERNASDRPEWRPQPMVPVRESTATRRSGTSSRPGSTSKTRRGLSVTGERERTSRAPSAKQTSAGSTSDDPLSKIGCFIATASLEQTSEPGEVVTNSTGNYRLPARGMADLQRLRRFRDRVLNRWSPGQAVVHSYYRHSPSIARMIRHDENARTLVRWLIVKPAVMGAGVALGEDRSPAYVLLALLGLLLVRLRRRRSVRPH